MAPRKTRTGGTGSAKTTATARNHHSGASSSLSSLSPSASLAAPALQIPQTNPSKIKKSHKKLATGDAAPYSRPYTTQQSSRRRNKLSMGPGTLEDQIKAIAEAAAADPFASNISTRLGQSTAAGQGVVSSSAVAITSTSTLNSSRCPHQSTGVGKIVVTSPAAVINPISILNTSSRHKGRAPLPASSSLSITNGKRKRNDSEATTSIKRTKIASNPPITGNDRAVSRAIFRATMRENKAAYSLARHPINPNAVIRDSASPTSSTIETCSFSAAAATAAVNINTVDALASSPTVNAVSIAPNDGAVDTAASSPLSSDPSSTFTSAENTTVDDPASSPTVHAASTGTQATTPSIVDALAPSPTITVAGAAPATVLTVDAHASSPTVQAANAVPGRATQVHALKGVRRISPGFRLSLQESVKEANRMEHDPETGFWRPVYFTGSMRASILFPSEHKETPDEQMAREEATEQDLREDDRRKEELWESLHAADNKRSLQPVIGIADEICNTTIEEAKQMFDEGDSESDSEMWERIMAPEPEVDPRSLRETCSVLGKNPESDALKKAARWEKERKETRRN